jgi:hypothetical protein
VTLDERLAGAAESLRRSVRRDAPPFEVIRRRARRRRVVGTGVGLVTVVGAVVAVFALMPFGGSGGSSGGDGSTVYGEPGPKTGGGVQASCLSVVAHDGKSIAGCELATDANSGTARLDELTARYGGVPVYRDGSAREQVGIVTPDLRFVPLKLVRSSRSSGRVVGGAGHVGGSACAARRTAGSWRHWGIRSRSSRAG